MTTLDELAEELSTTTHVLREFNSEDFAAVPADAQLSADVVVATREAWAAGQDKADTETVNGMTDADAVKPDALSGE